MNASTHGWSVGEDAYLENHYQTQTHAQMGALLGRSAAAVRNRCWRLNLGKKVAKHSEATIERIRTAYERHAGQALDLAALAKELGMRRSTIARIAGNLGLTDPTRPHAPQSRAEGAAKLAFRWRMGGHPRGMAGKHHTLEARRLMAQTRAAAYAQMTPVERSKRVLAGMKTREKRGALIPPRPNATWKQAWHTIGGKRHYFRSKWEVNYAHYLEWLKQRGDIRDWEYEPTTFWFDKIKRGTRSYTPDFRVTEPNGVVAYHEIKGWMDDRSKTKLKRMAKYHPTVNVIVVDADAYKKLNRQVLGLVPGWS